MSQSLKHQPWHDVAVFENWEAGKSLEAFLTDNGYESRTYDDKAFRYFLFLRPPVVTWRVQVRKDLQTKAGKLLEAKSPAVLTKAMHCPACGSLRINYPQMTRRFVLPTILLHLGIIFRVIDHQCYCESCHHMWDLIRPGAAVRKVRDAKPFPF